MSGAGVAIASILAVMALVETSEGQSGAAFDTDSVELLPGGWLTDLTWLAGCWRRETRTQIVEEQWMEPGASLMLGMGRTLTPDHARVVEYEQNRIVGTNSGAVLTAMPSGQPTASFNSVELTDSMVIFENLEHDFPQRVGYRRLADGNLGAWIEGTSKGKYRRIDFPYQRVSCPGASK